MVSNISYHGLFCSQLCIALTLRNLLEFINSKPSNSVSFIQTDPVKFTNKVRIAIVVTAGMVIIDRTATFGLPNDF